MKTFFHITCSLILSAASLISYGQTTLAESHFEGDDINSVRITGSFCDVTVTPSDRLVFDGLIKGEGDEGDYVIATIKSRGELIIKVERKKDRNWGWNDIDQARLDLELPKGVALDIDNSSGDVRVSGYEGNLLTVSASSGDVFLKDILADVRVRTSSGDLVMRNVTGEVTGRSTSGDQELFQITGNVRTGSTSGDIDVVRLIGDLDIGTTSGDMELDDVKGSISASSTSGEIEGEYILLTDDSRFKSTSGNIYIEFENDVEDLGFDLRASSGDLEVGRLDGEDRLTIRRGDIQVTGVSTSGDQTYTN